MGNAKRAADAKRSRTNRPDPYATIHADLLIACACALTGSELAIWLSAQAEWRPGSAHATHGAVLPYARLTELTRHGLAPRTVAAALPVLQGHRLLTVLQPGIRPGGPGSARRKGKAAVYGCPNREPGGEQPNVPWPIGLKRPMHKVRWHTGQLRSDLRRLSGPALKFLAYCIAIPARSRKGEVFVNAPIPLPARRTADLLHLSRTTVQDAITELLAARTIATDTPASGRRPATYQLAAAYTRHQHRMPDEDAPVAGAAPAATTNGARPRSPAPHSPRPPTHGSFKVFPHRPQRGGKRGSVPSLTGQNRFAAGEGSDRRS